MAGTTKFLALTLSLSIAGLLATAPSAASTGCDCWGDVDLDCDVDGRDLGQVLINWGPCPGCPADLNGDGVVDGIDLGIVLSNYGQCNPPPPPPTGCVCLVIDEDSIDNGSPPNFFSAFDVNDQLAAIGLRAPLPAFSGANVGTQITLWTGQVGDEGWFAVKVIPPVWDAAGPTTDGLTNYVLAGPGLGSGRNPEAHLDKIPKVTPLRATGLSMLVGQTVCAVVYDSDISMNYGPLEGSLKGANLGIVAFKVLEVNQLFGQSSSSLPKVLVEIVDPEAAFNGPFTLFLDAPEPSSSSVPFDIVPPQ